MVNSITEQNLKQMVIDGAIETAIEGSGASSSCAKGPTSECGRYTAGDQLVATGQASIKVLQYDRGDLGMAKEIKHLPWNVRGKTKEIQCVPGLTNHLVSTNKFLEEDYVRVFDKEQLNVYDANDIEIKTTRGVILRGWRVPKERLWRFPLVRDTCKESNLNTDTALLVKSPQEILMRLPPPTRELINNVYELKTKPELIRYYHAAADFPTKPTWLAAINNDHYSL